MIFEHKGVYWEGYVKTRVRAGKRVKSVGVRLAGEIMDPGLYPASYREFKLALEKWKRILKKRKEK